MKNNNELREVGKYLNLGWQMVITIVFGIWIGSKLDIIFDIKPILMISCAFLFSIIALANFIRIVTKYQREDDKKKELSKSNKDPKL